MRGLNQFMGIDGELFGGFDLTDYARCLARIARMLNRSPWTDFRIL